MPPHSLTQQEAAELHATFCGVDASRGKTLRALYRRSGVSTRRSVLLESAEGPLTGRQRFYYRAAGDDDLGPPTAARMERYEQCAPALASTAGERALASAQVNAAEISHLVTVSCTGFVAPGVDSRIIRDLALSPSVQRTNVGFMGCHGALNGLRVARSFTDADPQNVVLICAVELCSLHFAYGWDPDMMVANALFSDGAAAAVGRACNGQAGHDWRVAASGTLLMDGSEGDMSWRIGDHGFRMTLSASVPDRICANLGGWLEGWLRDQGLSVADVASWAVHPGGPRILGAVERSVGLARDQTRVSRGVLSEFGNMSSATILFILDRLRTQDAPRPCVALAFGPGLVVEAALIR